MHNSRAHLALLDFRQAIFGQPLWLILAWQEVKQRYRRSILGPFWISFSTAITVGAMGPLYSNLLNQPLGPYFQHLSVSFVVWTFVAGFINEACAAFIGAEGFIKQMKLPYSVFILKVLAKNILIYFHNLVIVIVVLFCFPPHDFWRLPLSFLGLVLASLNLIWFGVVIGMLCARFRDIPQVVASGVQVLFFLTPIMWSIDMLGEHRAIAEWNLIYHLIEIIRTPLLGLPTNPLSWLVCGISAVVGGLVSFILFARYRSRISYWI